MEVGFSGETLLLVLAGGWVALGIPNYSQGICLRQKTDLCLNPKALVDSVGTHSFCLEGTSSEAGCRYHDFQSLEPVSGNTLSFSRCLSRNIPSGIHWSQMEYQEISFQGWLTLMVSILLDIRPIWLQKYWWFPSLDWLEDVAPRSQPGACMSSYVILWGKKVGCHWLRGIPGFHVPARPTFQLQPPILMPPTMATQQLGTTCEEFSVSACDPSCQKQLNAVSMLWLMRTTRHVCRHVCARHRFPFPLHQYIIYTFLFKKLDIATSRTCLAGRVNTGHIEAANVACK